MSKKFASLCVAVFGVAALAIAEAPKDAQSEGSPQVKLPPGWTEADMQACILAGTPGKMHQHLAKGVGVWHGKTTMWMAPGAEPMTSECASTVTAMMDGRFVKVEMAGEMPGMGPYRGFGLYGFDNVTQKFVATWIDNHSTGMLRGVGELSSDGNVTTWEFTGNCPITQKPMVMREVETISGPNAKTLEMFGADPKSGKEFQMMRIELSKRP